MSQTHSSSYGKLSGGVFLDLRSLPTGKNNKWLTYSLVLTQPSIVMVVPIVIYQSSQDSGFQHRHGRNNGDTVFGQPEFLNKLSPRLQK